MPYLEEALTTLRAGSTDMAGLGRRFERLFQKALSQHDGALGNRFKHVWLWNDWPGRGFADMGIDLVAEEHEGGLCAIQCKCHEADRPVRKSAIDSFMSASEAAQFTSRLLVNTGGIIERNALRILEESPKPCRVLDRTELDAWPVDWRVPVAELQWRKPPRFSPHCYQQDAIDQVHAKFQNQDRGQLILPCGTGKTAVTLWIAEAEVGVGGRVLYLVPSIALMAQTMREWGAQRGMEHRYIGICSDTRAGRTDEDASLLELDIPVTTDQDRITEALGQDRPLAMTVVFCTYQSLPRVVKAQDAGAPAFDLTICDEAHRTTGVEKEAGNTETETSPFRLVHDQQKVRTSKRLYTTATPRLYTEGAKRRAADLRSEIFSMDDPAVYGPEFYRMTFAQAIDGGWLSDYRVLILTLDSERTAAALEHSLALEADTGLNLEDATKLLGCWDALAAPGRQFQLFARHQGREPGPLTGEKHHSLHRAIAFTNTIRQSQRVQKHWGTIIESMRERAAKEQQDSLLACDIKHVDGTKNSLTRSRMLTWLKGGDENGCHVLSNARCLTEGVDVPALDAVLFLAPRKSQVDVVQAVGRVMRTAPGKEYGYIILPVVIPPGADPEQALDDNQTYQLVWSVLRALRSHDERLDLKINSLDLNQPASKDPIIGPEPPIDPILQLPLNFLFQIPPGAIYARIVEKCGDRKYWPQ